MCCQALQVLHLCKEYPKFFFQSEFCLAKKIFNISKMSMAFVVYKRGSQNRNSSLMASACTQRTKTRSWLHWEMSVRSSSCMPKGNGVAANSSMTCFKILQEIPTILECMTSFDKETASIFVLSSNPQTSSTMSRAHGFTKVSPIVFVPFFVW